MSLTPKQAFRSLPGILDTSAICSRPSGRQACLSRPRCPYRMQLRWRATSEPQGSAVRNPQSPQHKPERGSPDQSGHRAGCVSLLPGLALNKQCQELQDGEDREAGRGETKPRLPLQPGAPPCCYFGLELGRAGRSLGTGLSLSRFVLMSGVSLA